MTQLDKALMTLRRFHADWVPCSSRNIRWSNGWVDVRLMRGTFFVRGYQLKLNLSAAEFRKWIHMR